MMRTFRLAAIGAAVILATLPARAADGPLLAPTKDVAVIYKLSGVSKIQGANKLQVTYAKAGQVRLDYFRYLEAKYPYGALIFDPVADRVITVAPERRGYLERDVGHLQKPGIFLNDKMSFSRLGQATIAGVPCTDWHVANGVDNVGTACVTDDGVVLRATRDKPTEGSIEALAVQYSPAPPEVFAPPPDFRLLSPVEKGGQPQLVRPAPNVATLPPGQERPTASAPSVAKPAVAPLQLPTPSKPQAPPKIAGADPGPSPPKPEPPAPAAIDLPPGWSIVGEPTKP